MTTLGVSHRCDVSNRLLELRVEEIYAPQRWLPSVADGEDRRGDYP
jgi:hypothetical protein